MAGTSCLVRGGGLPLKAVVAWLMTSLATGRPAPKFTELLAADEFAVIPIRQTADHHWYLSGKLDGRQVSFLVDTGWSETKVNRNGEAATTNLHEFRLGRMTFARQPAEHGRVIMGGKPAPFDVVLGLDFLRRHSAVVDCAANRLYTRSSPPREVAGPALAESLRLTGRVAIDLRCREEMTLTCSGQVAGNPLELLVDTGAAWSCLDWRQAEAWGLKPRPSATRLSGAGHTGTRGLAVAEVKSLRLGSVEISKVTLGLVALGDWGLAQEGKSLSEVKGLLGGEILAAHGAIIDCGGLKLWLQPRPKK